MALTESALSELLAALQVGEGVDLVRELSGGSVSFDVDQYEWAAEVEALLGQ